LSASRHCARPERRLATGLRNKLASIAEEELHSSKLSIFSWCSTMCCCLHKIKRQGVPCTSCTNGVGRQFGSHDCSLVRGGAAGNINALNQRTLALSSAHKSPRPLLAAINVAANVSNSSSSLEHLNTS
jgi:hypothetical protein